MIPKLVRFSDLPTELALLIFKYAAQPTFAQPETYATKNPYSSAISLSCVSKFVRRIVLPEILHTVLLPEDRHIAAFERALRMQKTYIDQEQQDLIFDYTSCVRRIWIGEIRMLLSTPNDPFGPDCDVLDATLLAPLILAVPSLAIDCTSLNILSVCLAQACNPHLGFNLDDRNSPLPWNTKSLTLSGDFFLYQWQGFIAGIRGYSFIASIPHFTSLYSSIFPHYQRFYREPPEGMESQDSGTYTVPFLMARAPFKKLETFSVVIPSSANDTEVELVTLPASSGLLPEPLTLEEIKSYVGTPTGLLPSSSLPVSCSRQLCLHCLDCEKMWVCGYEGPGPLTQVSA
ncbi:hypothetical protein BDR07DRAFT_1446950 [Suillus spraguei]|nr:hypothetical protein BDR07DRAFT_1446950 [Suillus spraguei]